MDKLKELHKLLVDEKIDDGDYESFRKTFSSDAKKQQELHQLLVDEKIETDDFPTFQANFFPAPAAQEGGLKKNRDGRKFFGRLIAAARDGYSKYR